MANETTAYNYISNKDPNDGTTQIVVSGSVADPEDVLVQGGDPVELTKEQHDRISQRFNLRKATDKQLEAAAESSEKDDQKDQTAKNNDKTSAAPTGGGTSGSGPSIADGSSATNVPAPR